MSDLLTKAIQFFAIALLVVFMTGELLVVGSQVRDELHELNGRISCVDYRLKVLCRLVDKEGAE